MMQEFLKWLAGLGTGLGVIIAQYLAHVSVSSGASPVGTLVEAGVVMLLVRIASWIVGKLPGGVSSAVRAARV